MHSIAHSLLRLRCIPALAALLLSCVPAAWAADGDAAKEPRPVQVRVHHGLDLPWNKPGFRIDVANWRPNGDVSISAFNIKGERVELTPEPLAADAQGTMSLDVSYERSGLTPGRWTLVVGEGPTAHRVPVTLPEIDAPAGTRPRFRMTYPTASRP